MNAYSSISGERTGVRRLRLLSRTYRKGLREGLGAPSLFFNPLTFSRTEAIDASLEIAWRKVGDVLKNATKKEEEQIGKATRKANAGDPARNR